VLISDTIKSPSEFKSLVAFIDNISVNMSDIINSDACNLQTNLMLSKYANLDKAFAILKKSLANKKNKNDADDDDYDDMRWFISFRNCKLKAVEYLYKSLCEQIKTNKNPSFNFTRVCVKLKASRMIMPKPYFYPINLQAPAYSWLLLAQNYKNYENTLEVYGLIIFTQLNGSIKVTLKVNNECQTLCKDLTVDIHAGESLVLFSDMLTLSYEYLNSNHDGDFSMTFITETNL
jgi:hypothetical protein